MNETTSLLQLLEPTPIYSYGQGLALAIYAIVTPVLLLIAIFIRTMETQLDVIAGQGRWSVAVRDFLGWGFVISVYFGLANLVAEFMNALFIWMDKLGSMKAISDSLAALVEGLKAKAAAEAGEKGTLAAVADNLTTLPGALVSLGFYYLSLILVTTLNVFFKIAHAIGYSLAVAYGLIAIPLSITRSLKLMRGWAMFMGFLLLWPLVEAFCLALFSPLFVGAADSLLLNQTLRVGDTTFAIYMLFTVLNIVVFAIILAAPFVAGALAANAPAHVGLVAPFATAAVAAAAALFKSRPTKSGTGGTTGAAASLLGGESARGGEPKPRMVERPSAAPPAGADGGEAPQPASADDTDTQRARQQRRGAIITQQRKRRPE